MRGIQLINEKKNSDGFPTIKFLSRNFLTILQQWFQRTEKKFEYTNL